MYQMFGLLYILLENVPNVWFILYITWKCPKCLVYCIYYWEYILIVYITWKCAKCLVYRV